MITIVSPGLQATIQDLGRSGYGHLGVPTAGAADRDSLTLANRLVGNAEGAAAIEFLLGGFEIEFGCARVFALTGAPVAASLDGRPVAHNSRLFAGPGQRLRARGPVFGLRTYLALAGGIAVPEVLGSRSTDSLSGIGPAPLAPGDTLPLGRPTGTAPACDIAIPWTTCSPNTMLEVRFHWGPREGWFDPETRALFAATRWQVSSEIDRIAARLLGPSLRYPTGRQLPTEGLHLGSVQVPASGQPIVHLANHPPTGGYPVIGVVHTDDVARIAQSPPGTVLRLRALDRPQP